MKPLLSTFNFKNLILGISLCLIFVFLTSLFVNYIIANSSHRLSKIYSSQNINNSIFFIGNSRSVPFNSKNFNSNKKIFNLSQNSMNSFQVENILKSLKEKNQNLKTIYIEATSLIDYKVQCQYSIFFDLKFFLEKDEIEKSCKRKRFFEKYIPITKINNELFYRVLYYYFFPKKDQEWTNNYIMPKTVCLDPKDTPLIKYFFSLDSQIKIRNNSQKLLETYADDKTKIFFFISPIYQKENSALKMEKKLLNSKFKNLVKFNTQLDQSFFKNCDMFSDTLHLSIKGINFISKENFFSKMIN